MDTRQSEMCKLKEIGKKFKLWNSSQSLTRDTLSEVGCEMDMASIVEDTQRTRFCPQTGKVKRVYPFQLRWASGIIKTVSYTAGREYRR